MGQRLTRRRFVETTAATLAAAYAIAPRASAAGQAAYRDLIERWAKGRPVPLLFSRELVEAAAELRIACTPP